MTKFIGFAIRAAVPLMFATSVCVAYCDQRSVHVCVQDQSGRAVADVLVQGVGDGGLRVSTGASGCADVTVASGVLVNVKLSHAGFEDLVQRVGTSAEVLAVMRPAVRNEVVDVTAARVPLAVDATASSVRTLSSQQLSEAPGLTLDDQLRQVAGFQLFRRTSGWVANPTTQGSSLRGLGSTAASRTLVLSDQVPLNDAFGGWIHWNEAPQLAISDVELMRGGASDLYGSSAIGGVIDVVPVRPRSRSGAVDISGASRGTSSVNGLVTESAGRWDALAATTLFQTDGYTLTAPVLRGAVDIPSNVHSQSGRV
jgi:outer membrane receptor protein involved in Fe transport